METLPYITIYAAFLAAGFIKGLTGLGYSTTCLGILAVFIDPKLAIALVIIPSVTSNIFVMVEVKQFRSTLKRLWPAYLCVLPGLILGLYLLKSVDSDFPRALLGTVLVAYGGWALTGANPTTSPLWEKRLTAPVGFATGVINGLTGSQVMPLVPYLLSLRLDKNTLIQGANISFTPSSLIMLVGMNKLGIIDEAVVIASTLGIAPMFAGVYLGGKLRRRKDDAFFRKAVLFVMVALGVGLVVKAVIL
jgi:uncharacterized membrane protein YfcA